jgi:hypothetical protein
MRGTVVLRFLIAILLSILIIDVRPALSEDLQELRATLVRLVKKRKDIEDRLEDSIAQKRKFEREGDQLSSTLDAINRDTDTLNKDIVDVGRTACTGTVGDESEREALIARCNAAKVPLQARKEQIETRRANFEQERTHFRMVLMPRELLRAQQAQELYKENQANEAQIALIEERIKGAEQASSKGDCVRSCLTRGSLDAQSQCLQVCFDNANANLGAPPWSPFDK